MTQRAHVATETERTCVAQDPARSRSDVFVSSPPCRKRFTSALASSSNRFSSCALSVACSDAEPNRDRQKTGTPHPTRLKGRLQSKKPRGSWIFQCSH